MKQIVVFAFLLLSALVHSNSARGASFTPSVVVAQDGSGNYSTLQAAIDAAPDNGTKPFVVYIKNGVYDTEKLLVPVTKTQLVFVGENREKTIISYHIYDCNSPESENKRPVEAWALWKDNRDLIRTSATLTVLADDCTFQNLTIRNTAGPVGQALALTLRGDRTVFLSCNLLGYQDTIFMPTDGKRHYYYDCMVLGRTDYIYGGGIGYFHACEIRSYGGGWVTAPSTPEDQKYGFVFHQCTFTYVSGSPREGDDGEWVAIGRPWHKFPKVAILNSYLCGQMHPEGWPTTWNMEYASTSDKLGLYEYNNVGKGADMSQRAKWKALRALTEEEAGEYTIRAVLGGNDRWDPTARWMK